MNSKKYIAISGFIFGAVSIAHVLRLLNQTSVQLGDWDVPIAVSWLGLAVASSLCAWAVILLRKD